MCVCVCVRERERERVREVRKNWIPNTLIIFLTAVNNLSNFYILSFLSSCYSYVLLHLESNISVFENRIFLCSKKFISES
jgi:hypothetical protein